MAVVVLLLLGAALLALTAWSRAGRSPGARWWARGAFSQRAVLLVFPGAGIACLAAAGLSGYDSGDGGARLWLALPAAVGLAAAVWGALLLPVPRPLQPQWLRTTKGAPSRGRR